MRNFAKVSNDSTVVRDMHSNAILSNDRESYERRRQIRKTESDKNRLEKRIEELEKRLEMLEKRLMTDG